MDTTQVRSLAGGHTSVSAGASAETPVLRLTRRGRVVLGGLTTILVAALLAGIASLAAPGAEATLSEGDQEFSYVLVQPGATLWDIAHALDPESDPRDLVTEIARLNQLSGSGIEAGDSLAVPLRYADAVGVVAVNELTS